jgi:hypothetical protein
MTLAEQLLVKLNNAIPNHQAKHFIENTQGKTNESLTQAKGLHAETLNQFSFPRHQ